MANSKSTLINTRIVEMAATLGSISSLTFSNIFLGRVVMRYPPMKAAITTSSKLNMNAKRAPVITPGRIMGRTIMIYIFMDVPEAAVLASCARF